MPPLKRAAEVDDVTVFHDVVFPFQPLKVLGLGLLERAGAGDVIKRGDLGPDEALGQIGVDLAGGEPRRSTRVRGSSRAPRAHRP